MAVCGHCAVCADKFVCQPGKGCADCDDSGAAIVRPLSPGPRELVRVCGDCVDLIDRGVLVDLISAIRRLRDAPT